MTIVFWMILALMTLLAMALVIVPLRKQFKLSVLLMVALPVVAFTLYFHWGASHQLVRYWVLKKEAAVIKAELEHYKNPQQLIKALRTHLRHSPNSARGWYLLGQLYFGQERYYPAVQALQQAYQLMPANHQYAVAYAQAQFFHNNRRLDLASKAILRKVIEQSAHYAPAINLLAINAYLQKHYQQAANDWQKLIVDFSPQSKDGKMLFKMIAMAQKHIANHPVSHMTPQLRVHVSVLPRLRADLAKQQILYVFAQPARSAMPLVVVRTSAAKLPLTVLLNNTHAMLAGRDMHLGQWVSVRARVGDLQSPAKLVRLGKNNAINLQINTITGVNHGRNHR